MARFLSWILACSVASTLAFSSIYPRPDSPKRWIGTIDAIYSEPGDTLNTIAKRKGIDLALLKKANPGIKKLQPWTRLELPPHILPEQQPPADREGIVINLSEKKLYHFSKDDVAIFPVAVGRPGWESKTGKTKVIEKTIAPKWFPPESIREYTFEKRGIELPEVVDSWPNPENPLGTVSMRLGTDSGKVLIHGTNAPETIGKASSSGCFRMFNEDAEALFARVNVGTPVWVIDEPNTPEQVAQILEEARQHRGYASIDGMNTEDFPNSQGFPPES